MSEKSPWSYKNLTTKFAGDYAELFYCQYFYDPWCKRSTNLADFTQLERDFMEDKLLRCHDKNPLDKVVALIDYPEPAK